MLRTYSYDLDPTVTQATAMRGWLGVCRALYNAGLQGRRDAWRVAKKSVTYIDQCKELTEARAADETLRAVPAKIEQAVLRRVDAAFVGFFQRTKAGKSPRYPRFKGPRKIRSFSFSLPIVEGRRVLVPKLGFVRFRRYRDPVGKVKRAVIALRPSGKWQIMFACDVGDAPAKLPVRRVAGVDLGLTMFATLSDGTGIQNPRWFREAEKVIRRCQKTMDRRDRGSRSRERARVQLARTHAHVANRRRDFMRKLACELFRRYDLIAYEDLNIRGMSRGLLAKSISDVGWGLFLRALRDKAESAGRYAVAVDPRGTTQRCHGCGAEVRKSLAEREHRCACGIVLGRDHNAALNILALGRSAVEAEMSSTVETERSPDLLPNIINW